MRRRLLGFGLATIAACSHGGDHAGPTPVVDSLIVATVPVPRNYGIHDTFVRDGIAFVCAWNSGVLIYDVGNGIKGGSPAHPVLVSSYAVPGGEVHNAWWFHNPNTNEKKYLFIGQEGPGTIGSSSNGDLHVLDVSDLTAPTQVATFHINGAGPHNFWMDEAAQILYAAYYNAGIVSLDVSGTLSGDLSARGIDTIAPGGAGNTYVWGVQLYNGSLYATDMLSGFWQLGDSAGHLSIAGGGNNVPERYGSDQWVATGYAYSGTWGGAARLGHAGNVVKVWQLGVSGAPTLVDSIVVPGVSTISDLEVSSSGNLLMISTETYGGGGNAGILFYSLGNRAHPALLTTYPVNANTDGIHTATFGYINGKVYVFAARDPGFGGNPPEPALLILDVTAFQ